MAGTNVHCEKSLFTCVSKQSETSLSAYLGWSGLFLWLPSCSKLTQSRCCISAFLTLCHILHYGISYVLVRHKVIKPFWCSPVRTSFRPQSASLPVPEMTKTKDKEEKGSSGKGRACWVWACLCLWHPKGLVVIFTVYHMNCYSNICCDSYLCIGTPSAGVYSSRLQLIPLRLMLLLYMWFTVMHVDLHTHDNSVLLQRVVRIIVPLNCFQKN